MRLRYGCTKPSEDGPCPGTLRFTYRWLHIRSGKGGTREIDLPNRVCLLELLDHWNRLGMGQWQYTQEI